MDIKINQPVFYNQKSSQNYTMPARELRNSVRFCEKSDLFQKSCKADSASVLLKETGDVVSFGSNVLNISPKLFMPDGKPVIYGFGGNLCFKHMHLAQTLQRIFNPDNVAVYTPDKKALQNCVFQILNESNRFDDQILDGRTAYIISPSHTHADYIKRLLKVINLKGIFVDKPICSAPRELEELAQMNPKGIYAGDHYYFSNIAPLRLMGINMPFADTVKIQLDKSSNQRFTKCINEAVPYFKKDEIASISGVMHETDAGMELRGREWYQNKKGGGVLIDLQFHLHNLLNLMGLKISKITDARGLKMPVDDFQIKTLNDGVSVKNLRHVDKFDEDAMEDAVWMKGLINDNIPVEMECIRGINDNTRVLDINGKSGEKIRIYASSSQKRTELFDKEGNKVAVAVTECDPYALMFNHSESKFLGQSKDSISVESLFKAQLTSIRQIFDIKTLLGNIWR